MQTFLVGGAVRDELLGLPVTERDWVVVGASSESLVQKGFKPVGKDFPVFLHPQTREEYALARTERKIAPGYRGFVTQASPEVTLEQDLMRRDLTINAMARDCEGRIIDPYRGQMDLSLRLLRHVSAAFCEDPVRILRVARFAARYAYLGFRVAPETEVLMRSMVEAGEVDALVPERIWAEFEGALQEKSPLAFIDVLRRCGAFGKLFPELERLFAHASNGDLNAASSAGQNSLRALENAARISADPMIRFAALVHGLGQSEQRGVEAREDTDRHAAGLGTLNAFCERLRVPAAFRVLARKVLTCQEIYRELLHLSAERLLDLLKRLNAFRNETDLKPFLSACEAIVSDPKNAAGGESARNEFLLECRTLAVSVDVRPILRQGIAGEAVGRELTRLRIAKLKGLIDRRALDREVQI
ncbi:MAG: multifunctional CCA addition/repair protein [Methylococcales bacterium]